MSKKIVTVDFTTTAMNRPNIVDATYASFSKNLRGINLKDCKLFINIDPLPDVGNRALVIKVAEKYFGEVIPNCPEKANFTAACNWLWLNAESEYIFHLEDDWVLLSKVAVPDLLKYFKNKPEMVQVVLRAYKGIYVKCALSPSILHKRYYKAVAGKLNEDTNPEIQLRGDTFGIKLPDKKLYKGRLVTYPETGNEIIVRDGGRKWLKNSEFKKPKKKGSFISWEFKDEGKEKKRKEVKTVEPVKKIVKKGPDTLTPLADKYKCDKGSTKHRYTKTYHDYLYSTQDDKFKMLEIGFGTGASVSMWLDYFKNATLYCMDISKELPNDKDNLKFISVDQSSIEHIVKRFEDNNETFKIILDDGSHVAEDQQYTMGQLFRFVEPGGLYIIEDLNWKRRPNKKFGIEAVKTVKSLHNYNKHGQFNSRVLNEEQIKYINERIDKVDIYNDKIAFIRKRG